MPIAIKRVCHSCGGAVLEEPTPSQLKVYPNRGKFCSQDCAEDGELKECIRCKKWFRSYRGIANSCLECRDKKYLDYEPVKRKAWSIGANIIGGKGKTAWLMELIAAAIGSECIYCKTILNIDNMNLDHIEPIGSSEMRRKKAENKEARMHADRRSNLRLICRKCNLLKDRLSHKNFVDLLSFLSKDEELKKNVLGRLARSGIVWRNKKAK